VAIEDALRNAPLRLWNSRTRQWIRDNLVGRGCELAEEGAVSANELESLRAEWGLLKIRINDLVECLEPVAAVAEELPATDPGESYWRVLFSARQIRRAAELVALEKRGAT
jgi:hypothetical protein